MGRIWVGAVGAEREVSLIPQGGSEGQKPVVLWLSGPEGFMPSPPQSYEPLYLRVKEEASLLDVASALRQARRRGFAPVLTTAPPPTGLPEDSSANP